MAQRTLKQHKNGSLSFVVNEKIIFTLINAIEFELAPGLQDQLRETILRDILAILIDWDKERPKRLKLGKYQFQCLFENEVMQNIPPALLNLIRAKINPNAGPMVLE